MGVKIIQPDSKGRISIGKTPSGVVGYQRINEADGRIVLVPMAAIPISEAWLYQDKAALASVSRGVEQSKTGKLSKWGSFAAHAKDEKK